jgi:hypothetical protein
MKMLLTAAAILPLLASANAVAAQNYSGNWPLTVTKAMFINGKYCLVLTGHGSSGTATIEGMQTGSFQIINRQFVTIIPVPLQGQNGALTFIAVATKGKIGKGAAVEIEGGESFDSGSLVVGKKGGC